MIEVDAVTRRFGAFTAVDNVSFTLSRNELVGFVGPNGAGKSTLLRVLTTYLLPSEGSVRVCGLDVVKQPLAVRRKIGFLPGDTPLYRDMRVDRFLAFKGKAHGLSGARLKERFDWVVDACGLSPALAKRVRECSTGFRQRIGLASALIHDPEVIILDEPTHGLDPLQVLAFRELLHKLTDGRLVLFSSHIIFEVAAMCDRLLIINEAKLLGNGTLKELCEHEKLKGANLEELFVHLVRKHAQPAAAAK